MDLDFRPTLVLSSNLGAHFSFVAHPRDYRKSADPSGPLAVGMLDYFFVPFPFTVFRFRVHLTVYQLNRLSAHSCHVPTAIKPQATGDHRHQATSVKLTSDNFENKKLYIAAIARLNTGSLEDCNFEGDFSPFPPSSEL